MSVNFDHLPNPEPSSIVGFSQNTLVRDAENRTEETIADAIGDSSTRFFVFAGGRIVLNRGEEHPARFKKSALRYLTPDYTSAILLGNAIDGARVAVRADLDPETLEEPFSSFDMRSLLYSGAVSDEDTGAIAQASAMLSWHSTNKFCGKCGTPTVSRIGGYRLDCSKCDYKIFPRTDPVVIMLPVQGERCVMGRSPHFPPGWFSTLAGFVEPGETIEDAVRRETLEESGITTGRVQYYASQPWPFPHSLMIGMYCEAVSETIDFDGDELEDCRWFTREEVKLMIAEEHPDGFICPPNKAISSALIRNWVEG